MHYLYHHVIQTKLNFAAYFDNVNWWKDLFWDYNFETDAKTEIRVNNEKNIALVRKF